MTVHRPKANQMYVKKVQSKVVKAPDEEVETQPNSCKLCAITESLDTELNACGDCDAIFCQPCTFNLKSCKNCGKSPASKWIKRDFYTLRSLTQTTQSTSASIMYAPSNRAVTKTQKVVKAPSHSDESEIVQCQKCTKIMSRSKLEQHV